VTAPPEAKRARLRALLAPVLLWQLFELCAYGLLASPVLTALSRSGIGRFPDAAQRLFSDGGLWLLELIYQQRSDLLASVRSGGFLIACILCAELVPQWWLLRSLALQRTGAAQPARPVLAQLGVLMLALWFLRGATLALCLPLGFLGPVSSGLRGERLLDATLLFALGLWLLLQLALSVLHDLLALRIVAGSRSWSGALRWALRALSARGLRLTLRYGVYRALALGTVLGGELLLIALPGAGLTHASAGFLVHQGALFARLMLYGLWLSELAQSPGGLEPTPSRPKSSV
jgi:hypothetical protein